MRMVDYAKTFSSRIESAKAISRKVDADKVEKFLATLDFVGDMERYDDVMNGRSLTLYELDPKFAVLVKPRGIYIDANLSARDLRSKTTTTVNVESIMTPHEFAEIQIEILGMFKKSPNFDTNLSKASDWVILTDVKDRIINDGMIHAPEGDSWMVPVETVVSPMYNSYYYNYPEDEYMLKVFTELCLSLKA